MVNVNAAVARHPGQGSSTHVEGKVAKKAGGYEAPKVKVKEGTPKVGFHNPANPWHSYWVLGREGRMWKGVGADGKLLTIDQLPEQARKAYQVGRQAREILLSPPPTTNPDGWDMVEC